MRSPVAAMPRHLLLYCLFPAPSSSRLTLEKCGRLHRGICLACQRQRCRHSVCLAGSVGAAAAQYYPPPPPGYPPPYAQPGYSAAPLPPPGAITIRATTHTTLRSAAPTCRTRRRRHRVYPVRTWPAAAADAATSARPFQRPPADDAAAPDETSPARCARRPMRRRPPPRKTATRSSPRCRRTSSPRPGRARNCRRSSAASWSITSPGSRPARSSSIRRTPTFIWCSATTRRCATASASAAKVSPGRAPSASAA